MKNPASAESAGSSARITAALEVSPRARLEFLLGAGRALAAEGDALTRLTVALEAAVPCAADLALAWVLDGHSSVRVVAAPAGDSRTDLLGELLWRHPLEPAGRAPARHVLETGRPARVPWSALEAAMRGGRGRFAALAGLAGDAVLLAPMRAGGRTLGVVAFALRGRTAGDQDNLALLEDFAARAAPVLERGGADQAAAPAGDPSSRVLEDRLEDLEAANRELESFSWSVAHDLRAPLRHIRGFAEMLERETGDALEPRAREHLRIISEAATRGGRLVDDLLAFARLGRRPFGRGRVDLRRLVDQVREELRPEWEGRAVEWSVGTLPPVEGDEGMLKIAVQNLLSNALKYSRHARHARVEVAAERRHDEVVVHVRDNGVGFDMRHADRLFGVFQRLHHLRDFEGVGIGLANVRRIVQRHGGRVWAEGAPGRGATFHFALPATPPTPAPSLAGSVPGALEGGSPARGMEDRGPRGTL